MSQSLPVTVFTGFLGAGKTTIALSLLKSLPKGYNLSLLKNEFGDVSVDSQLMRLASDGEDGHVSVVEIQNGCLCCVLVGQMKNALLELKEKYNPDRILIETSGSAFPAPIAWQVRELANEGFVLDGIITVIDCVNFTGYEDNSYTAKLQAQYTDLIVLNKWESLNERELDIVIDHVATLNPDTPRVRFSAQEPLSLKVAFGLDTKLFQLAEHRNLFDGDKDHHSKEVETLTLEKLEHDPVLLSSCASVEAALASIPLLNKETVFRIKGFVRIRPVSGPPLWYILNWAFGSLRWTPILESQLGSLNSDFKTKSLILTVMGKDLLQLRKPLQSVLLLDRVR